MSKFTTIREEYIEHLRKLGRLKEMLYLQKKAEFKPLLQQRRIAQEAEPTSMDINLTLAEIALDVFRIDNKLSELVEKTRLALEKTQSRILATQAIIESQEERMLDINFVRGFGCDTDSVIRIKPNLLSGAFSYADNFFFPSVSTQMNEVLTITATNGNGAPGNTHVWGDHGWASEVTPVSDVTLMTDKSPLTFWEYARICGSSSIPADFVNPDNEEVRCFIEAESETPFNRLVVHSDQKDLTLSSIAIKNSGGDWEEVFSGARKILDSNEQYRYNDYTFGSGILSFPASKKVRLGFTMDQATTDSIAVRGANGEFTLLPDAKRKAIRINSLWAYYTTAKDHMDMSTGELLTTPVSSVAIFATEDIPSSYDSENAFTYELVVNGETVEVVPVNSSRNGVKIIRGNRLDVPAANVKHVKEAIHSLQLTVKGKALNDEVPGIGGLRICLGKAAPHV